jgi:hypothetical protein
MNLCASFQTPRSRGKAPPTISSGVTAQGAKALMASAAGTRMALLMKRALGHRPDHRQFAVGLDAGDLLGVERQVVAQHAGGFLGRHLGKQRHVVQHGGDVVNQCKQAAGHRYSFSSGPRRGRSGVERGNPAHGVVLVARRGRAA